MQLFFWKLGIVKGTSILIKLFKLKWCQRNPHWELIMILTRQQCNIYNIAIVLHTILQFLTKYKQTTQQVSIRLNTQGPFYCLGHVFPSMVMADGRHLGYARQYDTISNLYLHYLLLRVSDDKSPYYSLTPYIKQKKL